MATYDTSTGTSEVDGPAEAIDLERMTAAFRANFRLAALDYFECMSRLLRSPETGSPKNPSHGNS
jgi:hypothetical protein